jgi:hypothetical protein
MSESILQGGDVSPQRLKSIFDAAYVNSEIDAQGDLCLMDKLRVIVKPLTGIVWLGTYFRCADSAAPEERLRFANRVNSRLVLVRAWIHENGVAAFDTAIPVEGGISEKTIVLATRFFMDQVVFAIQQLDTEKTIVVQRTD